ncbi:MAG TPA: DNA-binding protein [Rhodobacteraceae bacterium]|nr:DNA-binding protein [Paracoccaceae bacterium]
MHSNGLDRSRNEHIADAVMHLLGVVFAVAGTAALLTWAALAVPADRIWPLVPYAVGLVATFALSAAYNMTLHAPLRAVLRRFDHAAIYLMIAGTYTPMAIIGLGGGRGLALAVAAWSLAALGIVLKLAWFHRWPRLGFALYLAQGWLGLVALWPMVQTLPPAAVVLIVAGGLTYTVGTVFHTGRMHYATAIWHAHVLAAAVTHYAAVILIATA